MRDRGDLYIVSGEIGSGKTTFCRAVLDSLEGPPKDQRTVRGILSPAVFEGQEKIAIDALDIASGERRRLAHHRPGESLGLLTGQWSLDPQVINWCNRAFRTAVPCDLFIVDELGPLEFHLGEGFLDGMAAVDTGRYQVGIVVVRTEFLDNAKERWPGARILNIRDPELVNTRAVEFLQKLAFQGKQTDYGFE